MHKDFLGLSPFEIGRRLLEAKEGHSIESFEVWLRRNDYFSLRNAANYIDIFKSLSDRGYTEEQVERWRLNASKLLQIARVARSGEAKKEIRRLALWARGTTEEPVPEGKLRAYVQENYARKNDERADRLSQAKAFALVKERAKAEGEHPADFIDRLLQKPAKRRARKAAKR